MARVKLAFHFIGASFGTDKASFMITVAQTKLEMFPSSYVYFLLNLYIYANNGDSLSTTFVCCGKFHNCSSKYHCSSRFLFPILVKLLITISATLCNVRHTHTQSSTKCFVEVSNYRVLSSFIFAGGLEKNCAWFVEKGCLYSSIQIKAKERGYHIPRHENLWQDFSREGKN